MNKRYQFKIQQLADALGMTRSQSYVWSNRYAVVNGHDPETIDEVVQFYNERVTGYRYTTTPVDEVAQHFGVCKQSANRYLQKFTKEHKRIPTSMDELISFVSDRRTRYAATPVSGVMDALGISRMRAYVWLKRFRTEHGRVPNHMAELIYFYGLARAKAVKARAAGSTGPKTIVKTDPEPTTAAKMQQAFLQGKRL